MKKYIEQEIKYGLKSKIYYTMSIFLLILFGVILYINYTAVTDSYSEYEYTLNYYQKNNLDVEEDLNAEYNVETNLEGGLISNPIAYYKNTISRNIFAASSEYRLSQLLESSFLYFPIVFGVVGLLFSTNDYRYKTIKLRTVRINKRQWGAAKQLSLAISSLVILLAALTLAYIAGEFQFRYLENKIPIKEFAIDSSIYTSSSPVLLKIIFAYGIALFFAEIGYTLGILFKNIYVGLIIVIVYTFVLPNFGTYDLKNSIFFFGNKIFDFYGVVTIELVENTKFISSFLIILFTFLISILINYILLIKRSSYES
ncbi:hypothetical protein ABER75_10910 [Niallia taxi]|uniref:hypothetical protein n=1 Tax=Niallia taxi TaxID=2499688 RepID=UPI00203DE108|nr:hypothetical protein [Niallia taxi]MCM3217789.1 hypothetical protein [Niallia taxi]